MNICQQKWLTTTTLGLIFSLGTVVSAKAGTVSYQPLLEGTDNNPGQNLPQLAGNPVTLGYEFLVNPPAGSNNNKMTAFGIYANPSANNIHPNSDDFFVLLDNGDLDPNNFYFPENTHEVALWEVDVNGNNLGLLRRITINPEDPDNPGDPNPLLGFIGYSNDENNASEVNANYFAYLALDDPNAPGGPLTATTLDDVVDLNQFGPRFRLGVTFVEDSPGAGASDQAWITELGPNAGQVIPLNQDLAGNPWNPGDPGIPDPGLELTLSTTGDNYPQGYFGVASDPMNPLAFPNLENIGFQPNPFFVAGNVFFGELPNDFPRPNPDTSTPEPNLIHGLLAMVIGGIATRYGKRN